MPAELQIRPIPGVFAITVGAYVALVVYLGYISYKKTVSLSEFFVMGGTAGIILGGLGYFATQYSMSTFMGVPGTIYRVGWAGLAVSVPTAAFSLLVPGFLVGHRLLYLGHKYGFLTLSDYFGDRYRSDVLRAISAILTVVFLVPYMGAQTIGAGVIVNTFTGAPFWVGVAIMGLGVTLYCLLGGIRGAMYTNVLQGSLMVVTAVLTFVGGLRLTGGLSAANAALFKSNPGAFSMPGNPLAYMPWGFYISQLVLWNFYTMGQPQLATKFFLMKNDRALVGAMIAAGLGMALSTIFIYSSGVLAMVAIPGIPAKQIDWVVPVMVSKSLHPVLASVLMSGLLAAGMSTIDSVVVVVAGAISRDLYQKLINRNATDESVLALSRWATLVVGVIATIFGIMRPGTIFQIILFTFGGLGIQAILLLLGVRWARANASGAVSGLIAGEIVLIWLTKNPKLAFGFHPVMPASLVALAVMIIVSLATEPPPREVVERHFST